MPNAATTAVSPSRIAAALRGDGFVFVEAAEMRGLLEQAGFADWGSFAASWDDLGVDAYMADGGRYRRRRFAVFRASSAGNARQPHPPPHHSRGFKTPNRGAARPVEPVSGAAPHPPPLSARLSTS